MLAKTSKSLSCWIFLLLSAITSFSAKILVRLLWLILVESYDTPFIVASCSTKTLQDPNTALGTVQTPSNRQIHVSTQPWKIFILMQNECIIVPLWFHGNWGPSVNQLCAAPKSYWRDKTIPALATSWTTFPSLPCYTCMSSTHKQQVFRFRQDSK